jgi:hypothetical protein
LEHPPLSVNMSTTFLGGTARGNLEGRVVRRGRPSTLEVLGGPIILALALGQDPPFACRRSRSLPTSLLSLFTSLLPWFPTCTTLPPSNNTSVSRRPSSWSPPRSRRSHPRGVPLCPHPLLGHGHELIPPLRSVLVDNPTITWAAASSTTLALFDNGGAAVGTSRPFTACLFHRSHHPCTSYCLARHLALHRPLRTLHRSPPRTQPQSRRTPA